jgi:hypothetical protein
MVKGMILGATAAAAMLGAIAHAADAAADDPATQIVTLEKQAADYRISADRHDQMAQVHRAGGGSSKAGHESVVQHWAIAKDLRAAADESEALAAVYRKDIAK